MAQRTMVRRYNGLKKYHHDADKLARDGWTVANITELHPRSGCVRVFLMLGIFALVFPPKPEIVVTYVREEG